MHRRTTPTKQNVAAPPRRRAAAPRRHLTAPLPTPDTVELVDYKVRCLSSHMGTGATTRVMIEFSSARDPTVAELAQGIEPKLLTWYVGG